MIVKHKDQFILGLIDGYILNQTSQEEKNITMRLRNYVYRELRKIEK